MFCGLAFMADSMEVSLLSFLAPCVQLEWGLSDASTSTITGAVFAGEFLGAFVWRGQEAAGGRRRRQAVAAGL